ncbi:MAG TPA: glycogen/starch/alpha-glucan phosphorylase [Polyangiaceae bacterium]|jgi:starch phosphorylase|nr:glycogen/starch/alpha-glucan phosphorylase [Polyangiaceae bacterium]
MTVTEIDFESNDSGAPSLVPAHGARVGMGIPVLKRAVLDHLLFTCARHVEDATPIDLYMALSHSVRDRLVHRWLATERTYEEMDVKRAYYLSSEFLTGRSLGLCLINMGLHSAAKRLMAERGYDLETILEQEGDPGLGNGGLGRLAACFMDSIATLELPAMGYGIRYEFGIFEQRIENGYQLERRDNWLQYGNSWEIPRHDLAQTVRFYGRVETHRDEKGRTRVEWLDTKEVVGLPHDSFIVGHEVNTVNTLRLWSAKATSDFNLELFNEGDYRRAVEDKIDSENISKVLYPADKTLEGKELRLKQQYFFVACSVADIMRSYKERHQSFHEFPQKVVIQLNDTHPAITVAELMRILVDDEGLDWEFAWNITQRTCAYTNHTLLPEALEKWPVSMFERLLPRHLQIIYEINRRFLRQVEIRWPGDVGRLGRLSLIEEGHQKQVRMAHLATVGSFSVNGVAELHTQLIRTDLMPDFAELWPDRFNNKTNGVTPRRWILHANPGLSKLISSRIGQGWIDDSLLQISKLRDFAGDQDTLSELIKIKQANKERLALVIGERAGTYVSPNSMFIAQVKRIHEYKRQLLLALAMIARYLDERRNPDRPGVPCTYIIAGKAAAGYAVAKLHIKLINSVADVINFDPAVRNRVKVAFIPNYSVSLAERIMPAADLSVQISLAGKEASGTGNMKFAMNGALTIGTLDGANVEIREEVGAENFYLFGLTADQVKEVRARGYNPSEYIDRSPRLREVIELIESGFLSPGEPGLFSSVTESLRHHDPYMCCADFDEYLAAEQRAAKDYEDQRRWARMALLNIAGSGRFSSDETIRKYAKEIWDIHPVHVDLDDVPA